VETPKPPEGFVLKRYDPSDWPGYIDLDVTNRMEERGLAASKKEHFKKLRLIRLQKVYGFTEKTPPSHPPHQLFVLKHESGEYAGHLWMTDHADPLSGEPIVHVTTVAIVPKYRRKKLGRYFLSLGEALARTRKVPELRLDVGTDNHAAIKLFEKAGFTVRAQRMAKDLK
jgi:ribosomal protein S18 acetylase RimI-like enzyme